MLKLGDNLLVEVDSKKACEIEDFKNTLISLDVTYDDVYSAFSGGRFSLILRIYNDRENDKDFLNKLVSVFEEFYSLRPRFISSREI